jgi:hypothetical protein
MNVSGKLSDATLEQLQKMHDEIEATAVLLNMNGELNEAQAIRIEAELQIIRLAMERKSAEK